MVNRMPLEPATIHLLIFVTLVTSLTSVCRRRRNHVLVLGTLAGMIAAVPASAQLPPPPVLDRNYRMGDGDSGPPQPGNTVSVTFDSAGQTGMGQLIDLTAVAGPRYEALPTTGWRPCAPAARWRDWHGHPT